MPRKRAQKRYSQYDELSNRLSALNNSHFFKLSEDFKKLNETLGESMEMTKEQLDEVQKKKLLDAYTKVMRTILALDNLPANLKTPAEVFKNVSDLKRIVSKDMNAISSSISKGEQVTLEELFDNSRSKVVVLDKKLSELNSVGGMQSRRYKISVPDDNNENIDGYFTENKNNINGDDDNVAVREKAKISKKYGAQYPVVTGKVFQNICSDLCDNREVRMLLKDNDDYGNFMTMKVFNTQKQKLIDACYNQGDMRAGNYISQISDPILLRAMCEYVHNFTKGTFAHDVNESLGISQEANQDKRNSAMSKVADLIGVGYAVAHSENVHVKTTDDNGNEVTLKGTFMEEAKGEDVHTVKGDGEFTSASLENITDSPKLIKSIADIQVLDFICGNVDRHAGNLLYRFENGKVVGVVGIDNDTCFGSKKTAGVMRNVKLDNLKVIPAETANKIMQLDEDSLKYMLYGYELKTPEIKGALTRLNNLKKMITFSRDAYKGAAPGILLPGIPRICTDEEIEKLSLPFQLAADLKSNVDKNSLFGLVCNQFFKGRGIKHSLNNYKDSINKLGVRLFTEYPTELFNSMTDINKNNDGTASCQQMLNDTKDLYTLIGWHNNVVRELKDNPRDESEYGRLKMTNVYDTVRERIRNAVNSTNEFIMSYNGEMPAKDTSEYKALKCAEKNLDLLMKITEDCVEIEKNVGEYNKTFEKKNDYDKKVNAEDRKAFDRYKYELLPSIKREQVRLDTDKLISEIEKQTEKFESHINSLNATLADFPEDRSKEKREVILARDKIRLDLLLKKLECDAAKGIQSAIVNPDGFRNDEAFKKGIAAGLIRYKFGLVQEIGASQNIEKNKNARENLEYLKNINIDINHYDECINSLMNEANFKDMMHYLSPQAFSEADIKNIAEGKLNASFDKVADAYSAPERKTDGTAEEAEKVRKMVRLRK